VYDGVMVVRGSEGGSGTDTDGLDTCIDENNGSGCRAGLSCGDFDLDFRHSLGFCLVQLSVIRRLNHLKLQVVARGHEIN